MAMPTDEQMQGWKEIAEKQVADLRDYVAAVAELGEALGSICQARFSTQDKRIDALEARLRLLEARPHRTATPEPRPRDRDPESTREAAERRREDA